MADSHVEDSSDKIVDTLSDCLDFNKLKEYITSESIVYDVNMGNGGRREETQKDLILLHLTL